MLVTLYLISANVYNSISAPPRRGFRSVPDSSFKSLIKSLIQYFIGVDLGFDSLIESYEVFLG